MCQGLTFKKNKCKNRKEPYCHLHVSQMTLIPQREHRTPAEFTILNKFLPTELALKICSYLSFKVTIPLGIRKTPQKLTPSTHLHKICRKSIAISRGLNQMRHILLGNGYNNIPIFDITYSKRRPGHCNNQIVKSIIVSPLYITVSLIFFV
jgi:hypothetical protein